MFEAKGRYPVDGTRSARSELLTRRFRLSLVTPDKVSDNWVRWTRDPDLMGQLNARIVALTRADLQRYVLGARKSGRNIVGIYTRAGGDNIGFYETEVNPKHATVAIDVLVDQKRYDFSDVLSETDPVLLSFLAKARGLEKAVAMVVETYVPALRHFETTRWLKEGILRQEYPSATGGRRLDVVQFGRLLTGTEAGSSS